MSENRILAIVGSLRAASTNRQLAETAVRVAPAGAEVVIYEGLADLPFYNEDIDVADAPIPAVVALREAAAAADALLVVTPEYNGTIPGVLKNAIDWLSRPYGAGAIVDKPVAIVSSSPSQNGAKWSHDDTRKSIGIAGGNVREDVGVVLGGSTQKFGGKHPSENPEIAEQIGAVLRGLVAGELVRV